MVWQFIDVFKKVANSQGVQDDDFSDRLSHRVTVIFLLIFTVLVGSTQFVGSPISCWVPAHFSGAMTSYTNNICWISNNYYVPTDESLPNPNQPRINRINYYQWVPFILTLMSLLFYLPYVIWNVMSKQNSIQARSVMKIVSNMDPANTEAREKSIRAVVKLIDRSIEYNRDWYDYSFFGKLRRMLNRCFLPLNKRNGSYISTLYMITKVLYVANVCGQFFLLNAFMGPNFNLYGFEVFRDIVNGRDFWESPRFPRVTMCDFVIRTLGENNQKNTIQCTLPINLFNEKIFMFLWFWLVMVAVVSVYSFLVWFCNFSSSSRVSFVKRYLRMNDRLTYTHSSSSNTIDTKLFEAFIFEYLKQDGVFLLRIVKKNTNDLVVGEIICALWDQFKRYPKFMQSGDDSMSKDHHDKLSGESLIPNGYHHSA